MGVWGFWLAAQWQGRAERAEDEYVALETQFGLSEADVKSLLATQQSLAADKAAVEDERVALEKEKADLESQQTAFVTIANKYGECSAGYSKVIADLQANIVTQSTIKTAQQADSACRQAAQVARQLQ